jgi:prophage regulatory protein
LGRLGEKLSACGPEERLRTSPHRQKRRRPIMDNIENATGFVRLSGILAPRGPIPFSKSTWWAGVKAGRYPKPVKLGPRITAWRVEDIRALIEKPGA